MNFIRRIFEDGDPQRVPRDESKQQTMTQMIAAKQCTIEKLRQDIERVQISGLVISKYDSREVLCERDGHTRTSFVFNFTIMDTKVDFINVVCWGTREFISQLQNKFDILSTLRLTNATVKLKSSDASDRYTPWTPSQYQLQVNEGQCTIEACSSDTKARLEGLESQPIREHNDFYTIEDVLASEDSIIEKDVNLLFGIREAGELTTGINKRGQKYEKLELTVFDQTKNAFKLVIWDAELIKYAQTWTPKLHVVFAIDLTIAYSAYEKSTFARSTSKTIFTVNPATKEGYSLYNYVSTVDLPAILPLIEQFKSQAITCTIEELRNLFCNDMLNSEFILLNAVVTEFNIDEDFEKCFVLKCNSCYARLDKAVRRCYNRDCFSTSEVSINNYSRQFEVRIALSDHTSTLRDVTVSSKVLENIFGFSLDNDFERVHSLTDEEVTQLKWKVLLERWSVLVKIMTRTIEEDEHASIKYFFKCISLNKVEAEE